MSNAAGLILSVLTKHASNILPINVLLRRGMIAIQICGCLCNEMGIKVFFISFQFVVTYYFKYYNQNTLVIGPSQQLVTIVFRRYSSQEDK